MTVQTLADIDSAAFAALLSRYGLTIQIVAENAEIPGSFWGAPEAGLIGQTLYLRNDTPTHSALHEASHWICMDQNRREQLHTDAGGTVMEECAVNWLQILLAEALEDIGREQMLKDMTTWGYSYREGSVYQWLKGDGLEARDWLENHGITKNGILLTYRPRN